MRTSASLLHWHYASISDGTHTTTYAYDSANQLVREDNPYAGESWTWTYDNGGNITTRTFYPYSSETLGSAKYTWNYGYNDSSWGDLLTDWWGYTFSYDSIGNLTHAGAASYTWEHGRQLASINTWSYTYDANGMRVGRTDGTTTYSYTYNGSQLSQMTVDSHTLDFTYDASGRPVSVTYDGTPYFYALNLQGDVVAILNSSGNTVVTYTYDAWGYERACGGSLKDTLGVHNPLRYRGYVYDPEFKLYYLESRYYNPGIGRFNAPDAFASTGQGLLGNNMFAYCNNNPVVFADYTGTAPEYCVDDPAVELGKIIGEWISNTIDAFNRRKEEIEEKKRENSEVKFKPNEDGGGKIVNSYTITGWDEIYEYSSNIKEEYPSNFKGSVEGMAVEWAVHNVACYIPFFDLDKAKDVDLGSTIFDDTHPGMNMAMWMLYGIMCPNEYKSDIKFLCYNEGIL